MKEPEGSASLTTLGDNIRKMQEKIAPVACASRKERSVINRGLELVSGAIAGGGLGFFLDRWLGTSPVLFIACFFLGTAAGFLTLYRSTIQIEQTEKTASAIVTATPNEKDD